MGFSEEFLGITFHNAWRCRQLPMLIKLSIFSISITCLCVHATSAYGFTCWTRSHSSVMLCFSVLGPQTTGPFASDWGGADCLHRLRTHDDSQPLDATESYCTVLNWRACRTASHLPWFFDMARPSIIFSFTVDLPSRLGFFRCAHRSSLSAWAMDVFVMHDIRSYVMFAMCGDLFIGD